MFPDSGKVGPVLVDSPDDAEGTEPLHVFARLNGVQSREPVARLYTKIESQSHSSYGGGPARFWPIVCRNTISTRFSPPRFGAFGSENGVTMIPGRSGIRKNSESASEELNQNFCKFRYIDVQYFLAHPRESMVW